MNIWLYILVVLVGAAAGFINTLAGSGSLLTLPVLTSSLGCQLMLQMVPIALEY